MRKNILIAKYISLVAVAFFACTEVPEDCGNQFINSATQFCVNSQTFERCWGKVFDPLTEFCYENIVYSKCNGQVYTPPDNPCGERSSSSIGSSSSSDVRSSSAMSSSSSALPSSSSVAPSSSSSVRSSSSTLPSSSSVVPSSSSAMQSSSSVEPSSSSATPSSNSIPLTCTMSATTGIKGMAISPAPTVACNGTSVTTGLSWTPTSYTPTTTGSISVSVTANSGVCGGMTANCGSIDVPVPTFTCDMTATDGMVGWQISPTPTVTCNGTSVTSLSWTPTNLTPTVSGSILVSVSASSGVCIGMTANCGDIVINIPCTANDNTQTLYCSEGKMKEYGLLTDNRSDPPQTYKTVVIGTQTWMAENLNYATGSQCYGDNCGTYGRLYNNVIAKTVCPSGWHLPSDAEWTALKNTVGGNSTAGTKLKSATGWDSNGNGTDDYGFSALPGDNGTNRGSLWSSTVEESGFCGEYIQLMTSDRNDVFRGCRNIINSGELYSVRCLQDLAVGVLAP